PAGTLSISNNTISNFSLSGASGTFRAITASTPTGLYTVSGNTIENISYTSATSIGSITGIYNLSSATLQSWNNNIIRNFSTPTSGTLNGIQNNTVAGTFTCTDNLISGFSTTAGGAGGFSANGIIWSNSNVVISGNTILPRHILLLIAALCLPPNITEPNIAKNILRKPIVLVISALIAINLAH
ncbi:MAG: hypothetical protein ACK55I_40385, partial [bacterium]